MTILVVDGFKNTRDRLCYTIQNHFGMKISGKASDIQSAIDIATLTTTDIMIIDICKPGIDGLQVTRSVRKKLPEIKIIIISAYSSKRFAEVLFKSGVNGYILKQNLHIELASAVETISNGKTFISFDIIKQKEKQREHRKEFLQSQPNIMSLTQRKREVFQLIARGMTTKEIASDLHLHIKTVVDHKRQIMDTLNMANMEELTQFAIREERISH